MQLHTLGLATDAAAMRTGAVLASQTIDIAARPFPGGGASMWSTEREYRLAGAHDGIDTFASVYDAVRAARTLSAGEMPGLAVVAWRGGFRVHDVHASSRTYWSSSTHAPIPPITRETRRSSVPFAAGNLRMGDPVQGRFNPAVARDAARVALVDGERLLAPSRDASWGGKPRLVEAGELDLS
jgi:hypothetical protein